MDFDSGGNAPRDAGQLPASPVASPPTSSPDETRLQTGASPGPGSTLLPSTVAKAVTLATRSTSLALRLGSLIGSYSLGAAKVTTLSSLELGRGIIEGILSRAGKDVASRSRGELGKADAETLLEQSLESLHHAMTQIVFWTATGFEMTGTTVSMVSDLSQLLLSSLDQFFGSTDSSRAIASIITLIRREFENPATGAHGERVGVVDLVLGLCGLALLQRWCRRQIDEEWRRLGVEETIWDVVVLNGGERVDVHEESLYGVHSRSLSSRNRPRESDKTLLLGASSHPDLLGMMANEDLHGNAHGDNTPPELALRRQLLSTLPPDAQVSVTTSVSTTKTITVDVTGNHAPPITPPPGVELVSEVVKMNGRDGWHDSPTDQNTYRVVYRVSRNQETATVIQGEENQKRLSGFVEPIDDSSADDEAAVTDEPLSPSPPPVPPKSSPRSPKQDDGRPPTRPTRPTSLTSPHRHGETKIPLPKQSQSNARSPGRRRASLVASPSSGDALAPKKQPAAKNGSHSANPDCPLPHTKQGDKKTGLRGAFRKGTVPTLSNLLHGGESGSEASGGGLKGKRKGDASNRKNTTKPHTSQRSGLRDIAQPRVPGRTPSSLVPKPRNRGVADHRPGSPVMMDLDGPFPRSSSRASHVSIRETRRESIISQTDTYSIRSVDTSRPVSPAFPRGAEPKTAGSFSAPPGPGGAASNAKRRLSQKGSSRPAKARHAQTPSIYTLKTNASNNSLIPYTPQQRSAFGDGEALGALRREGSVDGMFPRHHLLRNLSRYMRFASASYGSHFLKIMGIAKEVPILRGLDDTHHELRWFAHHARCDTSSILLSSFVDAQGGSDSTGSTNRGVPLVHYISLDHESKAVVLACRGTLGFEDVLADMTCDYDDLDWRGKSYKVHKGIHASARRLLYGGDGRVLITLRQALEEFADYGLILTGHSLGGAVTSLLGIMLSEPASQGPSFVTSTQQPASRLLMPSASQGQDGYLGEKNIASLPPGRPIHVYAYGPPGTMSTALRTATRGLITSVVNGDDLVPYLSLGVLHDFQSVALAFKTDNNAAKVEVRQRVWEAFQTGLAGHWSGASRTFTAPAATSPPPSTNAADAPAPDLSSDDDRWAYAAFKILRSSMMSSKLVPPGEIFAIESYPVLRREMASGGGGAENGGIGQPAKRVILKYVADVEKRFQEVRFGTGMLTDHSPGKYEDALDRLRLGITGS